MKHGGHLLNLRQVLLEQGPANIEKRKLKNEKIKGDSKGRREVNLAREVKININ